MTILPGDILLFRAVTWFEKLIALAEHRTFSEPENYCHAAIFAGGGQIYEAVFPKTRAGDFPAGKTFDVFRLKDGQNFDANKALSWCRTEIGKPYDWIDLFFGIFRLPDSYICTQFVASAYLAGGAKLFANPLEFITPDMIAENDLLCKVPAN